MNTKSKINQSYKSFALAEGSYHIASEYAILKIQDLIKQFNIQHVLEIGLGIGSIAGTLLEVNDGLTYTGTERNKFCLESLPRNLGRHYERLEIYPGLESLPVDKKFNLIIIDAKDPDMASLKKILLKRGIIVLEGDRLEQQKLLQNLFPSYKMVHAISIMKNASYSPFSQEAWQGGLKIMFTKPSAAQYVWWLKEKVLTKLKYQYPKRHFGTSVKNIENNY